MCARMTTQLEHDSSAESKSWYTTAFCLVCGQNRPPPSFSTLITPSTTPFAYEHRRHGEVIGSGYAHSFGVCTECSVVIDRRNVEI
jgi:hypothetical protein